MALHVITEEPFLPLDNMSATCRTVAYDIITVIDLFCSASIIEIPKWKLVATTLCSFSLPQGSKSFFIFFFTLESSVEPTISEITPIPVMASAAVLEKAPELSSIH